MKSLITYHPRFLKIIKIVSSIRVFWVQGMRSFIYATPLFPTQQVIAKSQTERVGASEDTTVVVIGLLRCVGTVVVGADCSVWPAAVYSPLSELDIFVIFSKIFNRYSSVRVRFLFAAN